MNASTVTLSKSYEPYGEIRSTSGTSTSSFGFTGEWSMPVTQALYLRSRWYVPDKGIFTSRDTWAGSSTQPMSYNGWLYTYTNPVNLTDPSGI